MALEIEVGEKYVDKTDRVWRIAAKSEYDLDCFIAETDDTEETLMMFDKEGVSCWGSISNNLVKVYTPKIRMFAVLDQYDRYCHTYPDRVDAEDHAKTVKGKVVVLEEVD
jgi:hypothetical protein